MRDRRRSSSLEIRNYEGRQPDDNASPLFGHISIAVNPTSFYELQSDRTLDGKILDECVSDRDYAVATTTTTTTTSGTSNPSAIRNDSTHARTRSGRVEPRRIGIGVLLGRVCRLYLPVIEELHKEKASARTAGGSDEAAPEGEGNVDEREGRRREEG